ncbi:MAG: TM2 domain-containing protein [Ruminococcaceae bacterium]|nr:TM2 domain-containing protein [Oscillospiraceae bacterium]
MFCKKCGRQIASCRICPYCKAPQWQSELQSVDFSKNRFSAENETNRSKKSRTTAGVLQLFLGAFGVGRFYLGYRLQGFLQILVTMLTAGIGGFLWGLADGLFILEGKIPYDGQGKRLSR